MDENNIEEIVATDEPIAQPPARKALLRLKCSCGEVTNISDEVIEHGLNFTMIIGNDHHLILSCPACRSSMTMFLDEIDDRNELQEESNKD